MGKHSLTRSSTYFSTHARYLERLKNSGLILSDNLNLVRLEQGRLQIVGRIICRGQLELTVNKTLKASKLNGVQYVQATKYSYHLTTGDKRNVFRYDNAHVHGHLGHESPFHVHRYDENGCEFSRSPYEIIDIENWPTLAEVVQEIDRYYWENLYHQEQTSLEL